MSIKKILKKGEKKEMMIKVLSRSGKKDLVKVSLQLNEILDAGYSIPEQYLPQETMSEEDEMILNEAGCILSYDGRRVKIQQL